MKSRSSASEAAPRRVLLVCLRRLGDLLLASALIRSARQAWPDARIDVLTFASTAAALTGNADVTTLIALPTRGPEWLRVLWPRFRHYDLALAMQDSDRAHLVARWCGRRAGGILPSAGEPGRVWKQSLMTPTFTPEAGQHAVVRYLRLADAVGIPRAAGPRPPRPASTAKLDLLLGPGWAGLPTAVVHPVPMYVYKAWRREGWRDCIRWLLAQGLRVCITGGPAPAERAYVDDVLAGFRPQPEGRLIDLCGSLQFAELTPLIESARVFIGPDTSVTHLAAATGTPTVALFGPSDPVVWGPWPADGSSRADSPWQRTAPLQKAGNVTLLQGAHGRFGPCIPCLQEGCERNRQSVSDCLVSLPSSRVIEVLEGLLRSAA